MTSECSPTYFAISMDFIWALIQCREKLPSIQYRRIMTRNIGAGKLVLAISASIFKVTSVI